MSLISSDSPWGASDPETPIAPKPPAPGVIVTAVSTGAFLLAWVLWGDDRAERARAADAATVSGSSKAASATAGSQDAP